MDSILEETVETLEQEIAKTVSEIQALAKDIKSAIPEDADPIVLEDIDILLELTNKLIGDIGELPE